MDDDMSANPRLSWVYTLQKPALVEVARNYGLIDDGLVPELRQRIVNYLQETPIVIPSQPSVLPTHGSSVVLTRRERRYLRVQQFQERLRKADKDRLINAPMVKTVSVVPEVVHMSPKSKMQKLDQEMPQYKSPTFTSIVTNDSSRLSVASTQQNVPVVPDSSASVVVPKGLSRRERHKLRAQKYYESLDKRKKDSLKSLHLSEDLETSSNALKMVPPVLDKRKKDSSKSLHLLEDMETSSKTVPPVLTRRERRKLRAQKYYEHLDKMKADLEALQNSETSTLEQTVTLYYEPWVHEGFTFNDGIVSTQSSVLPVNPTSNSEES